MSTFVLSNIYISGSTTQPGKLEFHSRGLTWFSTASDRKVEVRGLRPWRTSRATPSPPHPLPSSHAHPPPSRTDQG